ncbi:hypothetical protein LCGC14_1926640 [marine sediment metagenome]|uniref:DUF218 domain-containing protein n=1 Tax=marine sediment metagenome TaxID=412755 RepID=A0A0F9GCN4_9ZZZZ
MSTAREKFLAVLANGPLLKADAIVVLLGEDSNERIDVAVELMASGAGPELFLSGGIEDPPRRRSAKAMTPKLLGRGVAPMAVYADNEAMNTHEQAVNFVAHALEKGWKRALLVASPYHMPRAFLTVLKAIMEAEATKLLHIIPVTAAQALWWSCPDGMTDTRLDLYSVEMGKIKEYREHVASWNEGLDYLKFWESEMLKPVEKEDESI